MYKEKHIRSIVKTISWRITATITTIVLVWLFTGQVATALAIGGIEVFLKMLFYYMHERFWNKTKFGRVEVEPFVLWFTGLPQSGKTTLADSISEQLIKSGWKVERIDGTEVRQLLPKTGFSRPERNQHIERIGHLSSILIKNNISVVASFVSPYKESRQFVRKISHNFIEVYLNTSVEVCENRDSKGLYARARKGEIKQFTGIDHPYEKPENPELVLDTANTSIEDNVDKIMQFLKSRNLL